MPRTLIPLDQRFWAKVDRRADDECWPWLGARDAGGRAGNFFVRLTDSGRIVMKAPRVALMLAGIETDGLHVHHACQNTACVNPLHLEPMTLGEHRDAHSNDHCARGHLRTPENTYTRENGKRYCRACDNARHRDLRSVHSAS